MENNFTKISNDLMSRICTELSGNEVKVMLCILKWYNYNKKYSSPKQKDIADFTGIKNINHISESIQKLIEKGFITRQRTPFGNIYYITEYFVPEKMRKEPEEKEEEVKEIMIRKYNKKAVTTDKKMTGPKLRSPAVKNNKKSDEELRRELRTLNEKFMETFDDALLVKIEKIKEVLSYRQSEEYEMDKLEIKGR